MRPLERAVRTFVAFVTFCKKSPSLRPSVSDVSLFTFAALRDYFSSLFLRSLCSFAAILSLFPSVALRIALLAVFLCSQPSRIFAKDHRNVEEVAVTRPFPPYPPQAAQTHEQGDVLLRIQLENGKVIEVTVISGPTKLAFPAARWIKLQWKFKPGTTGLFDLTMRFRYQPNRTANRHE